MPVWQPGTPDPDAKENSSRDAQFTLVLDFMTDQTAQPYAYSDQNPVFAQPRARTRAQDKNRSPATFDSSPQSMARLVQMRVRYPREALMRQQQGVVYA